MDMDPEAEFSERRGSYTALAAGSPPQRSAGLFFLEDCLEENPHHFLDVCTLCMKALHPNRDIYMYRGDRAFCSEECRKEQIEMDEAMEQNRNLSSSFKTTKKASVQVPEYPRQD